MPGMISKSFKGDLSKIGLPEVFEYLRRSHKTGLLTFRQDRVKKSLYIKNGNVIFARSNLPEERLGNLLLSWGVITTDQYTDSVALLSSNKRQGRILVEIGAISPKQLWESVQSQIRHIVYSLFNWQEGKFYFVNGELPGKENITADVGVSELIAEGIRRITDSNLVLHRLNSSDVILQQVDPLPDPFRLEPFERHVLHLVNGKRTLQEICSESEIGDAETLKVLYMLLSIGYTRMKRGTMKEPSEHPQLKQQEHQQISLNEAITVIGNYNRMFSYLYRYMTREVGPITEHVLNKYLTELKENYGSVLNHVALRKDGTLDGNAIQENLVEIKHEQRKEHLLTALNEFLYAGILAVKKTLGPDHESRVIETLKDLRPDL
jgi:hypothetical protein